MNRNTFVEHFKLLLVHLKALTNENCFNELSDNYRFIIEPSERRESEHLTEMENELIETWNSLKNRQLSFDAVVELFYQDSKTPKWIDCTVYYSSGKLTIVHLFFSRQFRDEREIYYLDMGTGPFKAQVSMPPDNRKVMKENKFDVNWKKYWDDEKGRNGFMNKIKRFFQVCICILCLNLLKASGQEQKLILTNTQNTEWFATLKSLSLMEQLTKIQERILSDTVVYVKQYYNDGIKVMDSIGSKVYGEGKPMLIIAGYAIVFDNNTQSNRVKALAKLLTSDYIKELFILSPTDPAIMAIYGYSAKSGIIVMSVTKKKYAKLFKHLILT